LTRARRLALTACLLGIAAPRPARAQEPAPAPAEPPALAIAGYTLTGELSESVASLRRVLDAQLAAGEAWSPVRKAELVKFLARLQYRLVKLETRVERRTIHLTLELAPFTLIRRVTVDGNWPVLGEDVVRRMTLRAGTALPDDPAERIAQLDKERDRLTSFLYRQGYFEARVVVAAEQAPGSHEAIIRVKLAKGPSYTIGKVDVDEHQDLASKFGIRAIPTLLLFNLPALERSH